LTFDSYGNILTETNSANGDRFKYTGREWDGEIGLQYNRARYYDPAIGRWLSEDPASFGAGDANLYRYVENSPLDTVDPSGLGDKPRNKYAMPSDIPTKSFFWYYEELSEPSFVDIVDTFTIRSLDISVDLDPTHYPPSGPPRRGTGRLVFFTNWWNKLGFGDDGAGGSQIYLNLKAGGEAKIDVTHPLKNPIKKANAGLELVIVQGTPDVYPALGKKPADPPGGDPPKVGLGDALKVLKGFYKKFFGNPPPAYNPPPNRQ
jgi:RHS repeat-associated protein